MRNMLNRALRLGMTLAIVLLSANALAGTPDWLREAAKAPLAKYPEDTDAVVLLQERLVTVSPDGRVRSTYRKAFKVLRPSGRSKGMLYVYFDSQTEITSLKGWALTASGAEYEVKKGDAATAGYSEELYSDTRYQVLQIPAAQPGNVVGYEYQQLERPFVLQAQWPFQDEIPVRRARFVLELPPSWTYAASWRNHQPLNPQQTGDNRWTWDLSDIEAVRSEPEMPNWRAVAGHFGVSFAPKASDSASQNNGSWAQLGRWYAQTANGRRELTPAMRAKAREISAGAANPMETIQRLASYVQHNVRYVAIEIGIGGYQPHAAPEVFASGYGDCKDKATLLSALLHEVGIDSYYVLINNNRDYLSPDFPSMLAFNHVILAILLPDPADATSAMPILRNEKLGRLLLFDPTDDSTPLGYLPPSLQASQGLLVTDGEGELVSTPLLPPFANRIHRTAKLSLDTTGILKGTIEEIRFGPFATTLRDNLLNLPAKQRQTILQSMLTEMIDGAVLTGARVGGLHDSAAAMTVSYDVTVPAYAQHTGNLFLFRPCVLGHKGSSILEGKPRQQPLVFSYAASERDVVEISLPAEYSIDEAPKDATYSFPFADYKSDTKISAHELHYSRTYERKEVRIPIEMLKDLKKLYSDIADDERAYAILQVP
jgi:transglutaminase-like putative cysteine protease